MGHHTLSQFGNKLNVPDMGSNPFLCATSRLRVAQRLRTGSAERGQRNAPLPTCATPRHAPCKGGVGVVAQVGAKGTVALFEVEQNPGRDAHFKSGACRPAFITWTSLPP